MTFWEGNKLLSKQNIIIHISFNFYKHDIIFGSGMIQVRIKEETQIWNIPETELILVKVVSKENNEMSIFVYYRMS